MLIMLLKEGRKKSKILKDTYTNKVTIRAEGNCLYQQRYYAT